MSREDINSQTPDSKQAASTPAMPIFNLRDFVEPEVYKMKPLWWMRYGILTSFLILLVVIILAAVIKYPDIVAGEFRLQSSQPSIMIPLQQGVQMERIFKNNGDTVLSGDHIMLIKNNADYNDYLKAKEMFSTTWETDKDYNRLYEIINTHNFNLGELQETWMQLYGKLLEHYMITVLRKYDLQVGRLSNQLDKQNELRRQMEDLLEMNAREREIWSESMAVDSSLYKRNAITKIDLLSKEESYINKNKGIKQDGITVKRSDLEIAGLHHSISSLKEEGQERLLTLRFQIAELINMFNAGLLIWERNYLIESPIDGKVNFLGDIKEKKYMNPEEHIIIITPKSQNYKAMIKIPFVMAGKVETGQKVHFKLSDYPYREYGYIEGELSVLSDVAGADHYLGQVELGRILKTNSRKDVIIKENMSGVAEIITRDRSVLNRVFDKLFYIFRN